MAKNRQTPPQPNLKTILWRLSQMSDLLNKLQERVNRMEAQLDAIPGLVTQYKSLVESLKVELAGLPDLGAGVQALLDEMAAHSDKFDAAMKPLALPPATPANPPAVDPPATPANTAPVENPPTGA